MPKSQHPRPWRKGSVFGPGLRRPLREGERALWRARLDLARRAGRITALHAEVGRALSRRLGHDGQCDPNHATLATDSGAGERTVRRALDGIAACGLVKWVRRLVRDGWRTAQTSNAYALLVSSEPIEPAIRCGGQVGREIPKKASVPVNGGGDDAWGLWNRDRMLALFAME